MAERSAHLVEEVFPDVPVRQWVLSLPHRVRYQLAWDHDLCRAVVGVTMRAVLGWLRRRARWDGVSDGRGGAVAIVQRFGGALNLNAHLHALVLDGVFARDEAGALVFHPAPRLTDLDVAEVLATVEPRIRRLLDRRGLGEGDEAGGEDAWATDAPVLAGLAAASVQGIVALGRHRGARTRRLGEPPESVEPSAPGRCHARSHGFDLLGSWGPTPTRSCSSHPLGARAAGALHAGLRVPAGQRERLEGVCRYALRPPVARERLSVGGDGRVRLQLRRRWADGTTHLDWDPVDFLGRLAVLVPRPRINLILYHGVLAPRAAWRAAVVTYATATDRDAGAIEPLPAPCGPRDTPTAGRGHGRNRLWADLMGRTFGFDVLACPRCGLRLRLVALIEQAAAIARILGHLDLPVEIPAPRPARAPPLAARDFELALARPGDETPMFDPCS